MNKSSEIAEMRLCKRNKNYQILIQSLLGKLLDDMLYTFIIFLLCLRVRPQHSLRSSVSWSRPEQDRSCIINTKSIYIKYAQSFLKGLIVCLKLFSLSLWLH